MGGFFGAMGRGMVQMWQWMLGCCIFGLRLCWNTGWLLFSLLCAGIAMIMLLGVGMTIVLLCCGYPFTGIFITGLGGLPALPHGLKSWIKSVMPAYFFYDYKREKEVTGICSACSHEITLSGVKQGNKAICPHCKHELSRHI